MNCGKGIVFADWSHHENICEGGSSTSYHAPCIDIVTNFGEKFCWRFLSNQNKSIPPPPPPETKTIKSIKTKWIDWN